MIDVDIEILPCGEIRFLQTNNKEKNNALLDFLESVGVNVKDLEEFFRNGEAVEQIIGKEILCG